MDNNRYVGRRQQSMNSPGKLAGALNSLIDLQEANINRVKALHKGPKWIKKKPSSAMMIHENGTKSASAPKLQERPQPKK